MGLENVTPYCEGAEAHWLISYGEPLDCTISFSVAFILFVEKSNGFISNET
jgi:hypothetical protein